MANLRTTSGVTAVLAALGLGLAASGGFASEPAAKSVTLEPGKTVSSAGKLEQGSILALEWAARSSVACFPATKNEHFNGKHVLYRASLPAHSVLKVRAIPKNNIDISLYAYEVGANFEVLPPSVQSVVSCEASYGTKKINQPYNPGEAEQVELNAIGNPYNVVVGVAGAQKLSAGDFTLEFQLQTAAASKTAKITTAAALTVTPAGTTTTAGKLDAGTEIDLAWAANSSVACFPATSNAHFNGKHVVYSFDLPKYTTATVELIPKKADLDVSLYGYLLGAKRSDLPPDVTSAVSCEASYGTKNINQPYNPGGSEKVQLVAINNPYKAFVGVAGAQGTKAGDFELKVTLAGR